MILKIIPSHCKITTPIPKMYNLVYHYNLLFFPTFLYYDMHFLMSYFEVPTLLNSKSSGKILSSLYSITPIEYIIIY